MGSGHSTLFARRAITHNDLRTEITSIDPQPRLAIDDLCDRMIRKPLEDMDVSLFDELEPGDILFIDCSYRGFMNLDVTVTFFEVLPRVKPGILIQFHDIFLPYDDDQKFLGSMSAEQYLLAAYLMAQRERVDILLPSAFISGDNEFSDVLAPLWDRLATEDLNPTVARSG